MVTGIGGMIQIARSSLDAPQTISNLELWFRADRGITLVAGNKVSDWADQSGQAGSRNVTQGTDANRPVFNSNSANGQPGLTFDGATSNRFLASSASAISITSAPGSFYVVSKQTTGNQQGGLFDITSSGGLTNTGHSLVQDTNARQYRNRLASPSANYSFTSTAVMLHVGVNNPTDPTFSNTPSFSLYEKDVLKSGPLSRNTSFITLTQYRIGRLFQNVFPFQGDILEVGYYSKLLSGAEITTISNYAITRYGIV